MEIMRFSSLSESGFIPTVEEVINGVQAASLVLISFREWLHSYPHEVVVFTDGGQVSSHLFQRVASFLHLLKLLQGVFDRLGFSSLSESGFIPTNHGTFSTSMTEELRSHLFQRVASFLHNKRNNSFTGKVRSVLISFREWLHSYWISGIVIFNRPATSSHLFQRVASFLRRETRLRAISTCIKFSSLSESGFIPTNTNMGVMYSNKPYVLISFREWLHSYHLVIYLLSCLHMLSSHLFQRVASFLLPEINNHARLHGALFSSLSESGFIPTDMELVHSCQVLRMVLISFREWLHSYSRLPRLFIHALSGT